MQYPTLPEDWLLVESIFRLRWNFPHALGALDGRHFPIRCPQGEAASSATARASTPLYSWPWWMEILSSCGWTWGQLGQLQIFKHTNLRHKIEDGSIGFPDSEALGIDVPKVNFFILEDDTFPLKLWLIRPYSSRTMDLKEMVFNYRIGWGRTVVENAFGMLTSCFKIFQSSLQQEDLGAAYDSVRGQ